MYVFTNSFWVIRLVKSRVTDRPENHARASVVQSDDERNRISDISVSQPLYDLFLLLCHPVSVSHSESVISLVLHSFFFSSFSPFGTDQNFSGSGGAVDNIKAEGSHVRIGRQFFSCLCLSPWSTPDSVILK